MYIYYCWITALLPSYQDGIVAGMARKGYMVGPAAKDGKVTYGEPNRSAVLIALSVYKETKISIDKIYEDLLIVLQEMKAYYHSVVIAASGDSTWIGSNIKIEKASPQPPAPKKDMN